MTQLDYSLAGSYAIPKRIVEPSRPATSLAANVRTEVEDGFRSRFVRATVDSLDVDQVNVTRPGFTTADGQSYPKIDGVTVVGGDEVLMIDMTGRGGWLVLGKILRNP